MHEDGSEQVLRLTAAQSEQLRAHAEQAYPEECCGILLGRAEADGKRTVIETVPCANAHPSPRTNFTIPPPELIDAQKRARSAGLVIVGFYHSHPDSPAALSKTDRGLAFWPECSYVIAGVRAGRATEVRSFRMSRDQGLELEQLES